MGDTPRTVSSSAEGATSTSIAPTALHSPASLVARFGRCDRTIVVAYLLGMSEPETIELAAGIAASRIVHDGTRLFGEASDFLATASDEQRALVEPVNDEFMAAAATCLATVDTLDGRVERRKARRAATQRASEDESDKALAAARSRRKLYQKKIVAMAGGDSTWKKRINAACGGAPTLGAMAASIDTLVTEGRELAKQAAAKGGRAIVRAPVFEAMTAYAESLRATAKRTDGVASTLGTKKGELAWWGGACVWFLQTAVEMFRAAHEVDPRVPSLSFVSLRTALAPQPTPAKRKPAPARPADPTPA